MSDLTDLGIAQAAAALRAGRCSATELTLAHLARIERLNPRLNAYLTVTTERALADARRAADELGRGVDRGPLHGVPIGLKDIVDTAGIRTTCGSKVHATHVPSADAAVARKLAEAGAVLLGKLATHEYAFGVTTNNPHWGPTRNPWDTTRIPGGSSGGSGAAVAARMACGAIGTDTGGSIRMPAAVCGVVGLKPTYGRVSKAGVFPMSYLFDHVGPLTRTVEDAAIMLGAIAGYDAGDATTVPMPVDDYRARLGDGMRGLRIGVPRSLFTPVDRAVLAAVEEALVTLADLGATVREVSVPEFPMPDMFDLIIAEAKEIHADTLANRMDDLGADVALYLSAPHGDAVALALALRHVREYAAGVRTVLHDQVDLLVLPTCPIGAPPIGTDVVDVGGTAVQTFFAMSLRTAPFNAAGVPALTVPCGFTPGGLPIGLQIVGRPFDEVTVLRAGHAYEQATEWHRRRPPE